MRNRTKAAISERQTLYPTEFHRAIQASHILRTALGSLLKNATDEEMVIRLNKEMFRILQTDEINPKGQRNVTDGQLYRLERFKFNGKKELSSVLFSRCIPDINRESGELKITMRDFNPKVMVDASKTVTHFKIYSAGLAIDFENRQFSISIQQTPNIDRSVAIMEGFEHVHMLPPNSVHPLILVQGIEFCQIVNKRQYDIARGNILSIERVSTIWK